MQDIKKISSLTKIQGETKSIFYEASDELNLMIKNKLNSLDVIDNLMSLKIITEEIEKINNNEILETEKTEDMIRKISEEFKTEKEFFKNLCDYEEEKEARKITEKNMKEVDEFETKINNIKEIIIDTIEHDCGKLMADLNLKKGLEIERIKRIESKIKKLKISKQIFYIIKRSLFTNVACEYHGLYEL